MMSTRVLRLAFAAIFHHRVADANVPFRLMPYGILGRSVREIQPYADFTNILLTGAWVHDGVPIRFVEISFRPRSAGVNSVGMKNMCAKGLDAVREMLALRKRLGWTEPGRKTNEMAAKKGQSQKQPGMPA